MDGGGGGPSSICTGDHLHIVHLFFPADVVVSFSVSLHSVITTALSTMWQIRCLNTCTLSKAHNSAFIKNLVDTTVKNYNETFLCYDATCIQGFRKRRFRSQF